MIQSDADELVEDAEIDGLSKRSGFGSFLKGLLLGAVCSGAVLIGLSLSHPLPQTLPGLGTVHIEGQTSVQTSGRTEAQTPEQVVIAEQALETVEPVESSAPPEGAEAVPAQATLSAPQQPTAEAEPSAPSTATGAEAPAATSDEQIAAVAPAIAVPEAVALPPVPPLALSGPAIEVNARAFEAPPNAPLLAVVLADAGNGALETDALALMTMPLTLAIRPEGSSSTALAKAARDAKHEILVQLPFARSEEERSSGFLHDGQSGPDRAALTERNLAQLPDALGVAPPDGAILLQDAQAMQSVLDPLQQHGFAFIDITSGNGSRVGPIARSAGLKYGETNRYAPAGASAEDVYNTIETAAFQARQRGSAIVQIEASRDALTAILRWGLEKDRRPVWFAPVSAVLKRQSAAQ